MSGPVADSSAYLAAMAARPGFPPGPHLVCGPLQHNAPLTSLRHLAAGQQVVVLGGYDAEAFLRRVEEWRVTSTVMVPTHFQRLLALPEGSLATNVARDGIDLHVQGALADLLDAVAPAVPDLMVEAGNSRVELDLHVGGTLTMPQPAGTLRVEASRLGYRDQ